MNRNIALAVLTAFSIVSSAHAVEFKLPFDAESIATQAKRKCPEFVKISGEKDVLTISISAEGKGRYDGQYTINAKKGSGYKADFTIEVKTENLSSPDGNSAPKDIGRISIGNSSHLLSGDKSDWQTYSFKKVSIPANGMLKLKISLRGVCGDIAIRNPRASAEIPQRYIDDKVKKKKKKKNKN